MLKDYKISRIRTADTGIEVLVRFYEGTISTEPERFGTVTRYRRHRLLEERVFGLPDSKNIEVIFKKALKNDFQHTPIPQQE